MVPNTTTFNATKKVQLKVLVVVVLLSALQVGNPLHFLYECEDRMVSLWEFGILVFVGVEEIHRIFSIFHSLVFPAR